MTTDPALPGAPVDRRERVGTVAAKFRVVWEIEIDAENPVEAAALTWGALRQGGSPVGSCTVTGRDGSGIRLNFEPEEEWPSGNNSEWGGSLGN